jgi:Complex 1 protein (LYR family)
MDYDIPKSVEQCREKLREEFDKHRHVTDIRVIDMLVVKVCIIHNFIIKFDVYFLSLAKLKKKHTHI